MFMNQYGASESLRSRVRKEIIDQIPVKPHPLKRTKLIEEHLGEEDLLTIYQKFDMMVAEAQQISQELGEDNPEWLKEWELLARSFNLVYHKKKGNKNNE